MKQCSWSYIIGNIPYGQVAIEKFHSSVNRSIDDVKFHLEELIGFEAVCLGYHWDHIYDALQTL